MKNIPPQLSASSMPLFQKEAATHPTTGLRGFVSRYPVLTLCTLVLGVQLGIVLMTAYFIPTGMRMHDVPKAHAIFRFRVFGPLFFAIALTWYLEGTAGLKHLFSAYTIWRVPARFYAFATTWKFLFCFLAWAIADLLGILPWPGAIIPNMIGGDWSQLWLLISGIPFILGIALVEETTWMKFCVTRLQQRYSALTSCLLTGIAWGLWYLPMLLMGEGVPDGVPWYMFLLSMVGLTVLLGWAYNMTHSGLLLLVMQVVSNVAFFTVPALPMVHDGDPSYVLAFVWVEVAIAAYLVWRFGPRNLGPGPRPVWTIGKKDLDPPEMTVLHRPADRLAP